LKSLKKLRKTLSKSLKKLSKSAKKADLKNSTKKALVEKKA